MVRVGLVKREAVLGVVQVGSTAVNKSSNVKTSEVATARVIGPARDPAVHPGLGRQPARHAGDEVGKADAAVPGAERDPRRVPDRACVAMPEANEWLASE